MNLYILVSLIQYNGPRSLAFHDKYQLLYTVGKAVIIGAAAFTTNASMNTVGCYSRIARHHPITIVLWISR